MRSAVAAKQRRWTNPCLQANSSIPLGFHACSPPRDLHGTCLPFAGSRTHGTRISAGSPASLLPRRDEVDDDPSEPARADSRDLQPGDARSERLDQSGRGCVVRLESVRGSRHRRRNRRGVVQHPRRPSFLPGRCFRSTSGRRRGSGRPNRACRWRLLQRRPGCGRIQWWRASCRTTATRSLSSPASNTGPRRGGSTRRRAQSPRRAAGRAHCRRPVRSRTHRAHQVCGTAGATVWRSSSESHA